MLFVIYVCVCFSYTRKDIKGIYQRASVTLCAVCCAGEIKLHIYIFFLLFNFIELCVCVT